MSVKAKAAKKVAPKRASQHFNIALKIDAEGVIQPQETKFKKGMRPGDTASFQISPPGNVTIGFELKPAFDGNDNPIPANLLPFDTAKIKNPQPTAKFHVVHACKSIMSIEALVNGVLTTCTWNEEGRPEGATVCTGGGTKPC